LSPTSSNTPFTGKSKRVPLRKQEVIHALGEDEVRFRCNADGLELQRLERTEGALESRADSGEPFDRRDGVQTTRIYR
jgi:hypothetical protein